MVFDCDHIEGSERKQIQKLGVRVIKSSRLLPGVQTLQSVTRRYVYRLTFLSKLNHFPI